LIWKRFLSVAPVLFAVFLLAGRFTLSSSADYNVSQSLSPVQLGPDNFYANWRAGSIWPSTSAAENVVEVSTAITTPSTEPLSDELYAVITSIWDSSGSYDQIGIADYNGAWNLIYSYATGCPSTSHTTWNAMPLLLNKKYVFYIFSAEEIGGGASGIYFEAYRGSSLVFQEFLNNGATYLVAGYKFTCPTNTSYVYYDYTDYEQVVYTSTDGGAPNYNFQFTDNKYYVSASSTKGTADSWSTWFYNGAGGNVPSFVSVDITGSNVVINN
jgi:hypothetical protein